VTGFVSIYRTRTGSFSPVSMRLYETLVDQASVAVERARLLDEAQNRAARERLIAGVSARMRETLDIEEVLTTAVDEIARALGLAALDVRLGTEPRTGEPVTSGGDGAAKPTAPQHP
jgi:CO/xanthine dehydrogenase Mo-binding subunit